MKSVHYAPSEECSGDVMNMRKDVYGVILGCVCCLLTGCLAILPPVFAQQSPEASELGAHPVQITGDERQSLLSLLAIVFGLCLWGGFRFYQHKQLVRNQQRMQETRRQLIIRIAGLDDRYAQGRIREHAYCRKREYLKQRVLDIILRQYT